MRNIKINITFDGFSLYNAFITSVIKKSIYATLEAEKITIPCELNVLITDDKGIRAINKASRNIDKATDVLSFPMFQLIPGNPPDDWGAYMDPETNTCPLGDMAISLQRAMAQAKAYGHSLRREVGYLTIHSMLHLLGSDHMDEGAEKAIMRKKEEQIAAGLKGMQRL